METVGTWWLWSGFFAAVLAMLALDILVLKGGKSHRVSLREAGLWSVAWVSVALLFNGALWLYLDGSAGRELANAKALEFLTGYLIEKSLAVDNVFVWLMIFSFFAIPIELQRRVLLYGVLGAIVLRAGMVFLGSWLISQFHSVLYLFGVFLLFTGVKMLWSNEENTDFSQHPLVRWLGRRYPMTESLQGEHFFVMRQGIRFATPLLLVLVLVEVSDVIFAVDSIPAIFAVTTDPFIVLTSNIFAILGLRAMYFLLADFADRFTYLKYGLGLILIFIGGKMLLVEFYEIPVLVSLAIVALILAASVIFSLMRSRPPKDDKPSTQPPTKKEH